VSIYQDEGKFYYKPTARIVSPIVYMIVSVSRGEELDGLATKVRSGQKYIRVKSLRRDAYERVDLLFRGVSGEM
jgi:hypothetical protein